MAHTGTAQAIQFQRMIPHLLRKIHRLCQHKSGIHRFSRYIWHEARRHCAWLISGPRRGKQACPEDGRQAVSSLLVTTSPNQACQAITILNTQLTNDTTCQRCGTCCLKGGPALHTADAALFTGRDALDLSVVVTFRAGEPVHDQVRGQVLPLERELLKLRGKPGVPACAFYEPRTRACGLYQRRPEECRALACKDTTALAAMYEQNRLRRSDLLPKGHPILAVLVEHEALVPVARIAPLAELFRVGGQEALDAEAELVRMARADQAFRKGLAERANIAPE